MRVSALCRFTSQCRASCSPFFFQAEDVFSGRRTSPVMMWFFLFLIAHKPGSSRQKRRLLPCFSTVFGGARGGLFAKNPWYKKGKWDTKNFLWHPKIYRLYRAIDVFYNYTSPNDTGSRRFEQNKPKQQEANRKEDPPRKDFYFQAFLRESHKAAAPLGGGRKKRGKL